MRKNVSMRVILYLCGKNVESEKINIGGKQKQAKREKTSLFLHWIQLWISLYCMYKKSKEVQ